MNNDAFYSLDCPLHMLPSHSQVRAVNLHHFPEFVSRLGGDYQDILGRYDIPLVATEDAETFIDCRSFVDMFEYCAASLNDPLFGLHLAQQQESDVYGFVAALCRAAPDLRQAIQSLVDFLPVIHSTESILELVEGEHISELRWCEKSNFEENDQTNSQGLLLNLKLLRQVSGVWFVPSYVSLSPGIICKLSSEAQQAIGCPIRESKDRHCIAFETEFLGRRTLNANLPLFQLLGGYLSRLRASQTSSVIEKVKDYIATSLSSGEASIEGCAMEMGVSARTLQARLKESDPNFSSVLENHRLERAKIVLRRKELSIAEVADLLGYSERTSFGRAFKRWTGCSPQQFRERKLNC